MTLKKNGQKQRFETGWYRSRMVITDPPCGMHTTFELTGISRLFPDDELQIKFQNFMLECDNNRIMIAFLDLIDDLRSGKVSKDDDWSPYVDQTKFVVFPDGSIRWAG